MSLEGEGEASRIRQIGEATANAYELASKAIGSQGLTNAEMLKLIASGKIKITPEIIVPGKEPVADRLSTCFCRNWSHGTPVFPYWTRRRPLNPTQQPSSKAALMGEVMERTTRGPGRSSRRSGATAEDV